MKKKLLVIGLVVMMIAAASPAYAVMLKTNSQEDSSLENDASYDKNLSSDIDAYEDIDLVIENSEEIMFQNINDSENTTGFKTGLLTIETKGRGLKRFYPISLFQIAHPFIVPPLTSHWSPFRMECFLLHFVYNDSNASSKITSHDGEVTWINGSHSLFTFFYGSWGFYSFYLLINDGLLDAFIPGGLPGFSIIRNIFNSLWISLIPGAPFFKPPSALNDFIMPLFFWPANFNYTIDLSNISEFFKNFPLLFPILNPFLNLIPNITLNAISFAFWPWLMLGYILPVPVLPFQPIINSLFSQEVKGYSSFVWYNKEPHPSMLERCDWWENFSEKWFGDIFQPVYS